MDSPSSTTSSASHSTNPIMIEGPVIGMTTLSILPSPSIQMARGLALSVGLLDELGSMTAFELFKVQLESGSTEAAIDAMKRLGVVCQAVGPNETQSQVVPYLTRLVLQQQQSAAAAAATTPAPATGGEAGAATAAGSPTSPGAQPGTPGTASGILNVLLSDELLLLLGQQLLEVNDVIPNQQELFLPLLERLAAVEETVVRDQAVTALTVLCQQKAATIAAAGGSNNNPDVIAPWLALVKRLSSADWFTAKVSSCGIVAPIFGLVNATAPSSAVGYNTSTSPPTLISSTPAAAPTPTGSTSSIDGGGATSTIDEYTAAAEVNTSPATPQQLQCYELLLSIYKELCMDETPMVRRAAAKHFGNVLKQAGWYHGREFGATLLGPVLCRDEQDSVRLLAVASLKDAGPIFGKINPAWTIKYWLPILKDGSTDMSWRVRNNLAKHFSDVAVTLGIQHDRRYHTEQSLVMACFVAMLTDAEAEVRAAAVTHLARMVSWGGQGHFTTHIQPLLPSLADDVVMEVRSKCALALMDAADGGALDNNVILQAFGPLLESFLQDEFHEVQLQVLSNLHKIAHLLPGLSGVVSTLLQMSKATNWRVREAVAKLLPHLAEARGLEFFTTVLLEPAWLTLLLDSVASVRNSIVRGMALLVRVAGQEWIVSNLLPHHIDIYNQNGANTYLVRITILHAHIQSAIQCQYGGVLWNEVMLQIQRGLVDKVPNVRMVAAKGLQSILRAVDSPPHPATTTTTGGDGGGDESTTAGIGAPTEETIAFLQGQVRPIVENRVQEEEDPDVRLAFQEAYDQLLVTLK